MDDERRRSLRLQLLILAGAVVLVMAGAAGGIIFGFNAGRSTAAGHVSFVEQPSGLENRLQGELGHKGRIRSLVLTNDQADVYYLDEDTPRRLTVYPDKILSRGGEGTNKGAWVELGALRLERVPLVHERAIERIGHAPNELRFEATGPGEGGWVVRDWKRQVNLRFDLDGNDIN